jgi:hypothetical protein
LNWIQAQEIVKFKFKEGDIDRNNLFKPILQVRVAEKEYQDRLIFLIGNVKNEE